MLTRQDFPNAFNGNFRPAVSKCRCPRCKSNTMDITETIDAHTTFRLINGRLNKEGGVHEFGGWTGRLFAECLECGHQWNMRKARMITDVVTELDPNMFEPTE